MIKEFQYDFFELGIVPEDFHNLLGFENNEIPEPFPDYIQIAINKAPELCKVRGGYKIFRTISIDTEKHTIQIENQSFSPSKIVTTQLKQSNKAALFLCTAGAAISEYSKKISTKSDPMLGYVFDMLGSVTVEKATDKIQEALKTQLQPSGLQISDRFSPGYCQWDVAEQHFLFSLLPHNFCGIKLSDSSLMHPIKSVSGIIGIGKELKQKGYQCQWCSDTNCIYGKIRKK
uniref:vitamin B12 dependent-methionine synthase activation domain-containing protein n=1 Tax=uncultured Draconibacterium sp. TaxID=1573823 RepID=UPI003216DC7D